MRWQAFVAFSLLPVPVLALAQAPITLDPARPAERTIAPGEAYAASLRLRRGESADITVRQQGVDLVVEVLGPDGRLLQTVDSPNGRDGDEPVAIVAARTGTYNLRIRPISPDEPGGRFTVTVAALRDRAATARLTAERRRVRREASDWLSARSAPLPASGILPADLDLGRFDALAADARIIGLGEATHGSREFNDFRLSLVKRLVERHNYRLIAIEDSAARWRDLADYVGGAQATPPAGLPLEWGWIGRRVRHALLLWARTWNLEHPRDRVRIVGVDPQDGGSSRDRFAAFLERAYGADIAARWRPAAAELAAADAQTAVFGNSDVGVATRRTILEMHALVQGDAPLLAARFGEAPMRDALATARDLLQFADFNSSAGTPAHFRDWYMAVNVLAAISESSTPPKTIYWAHNAHVSAASTSWGPTGAVLRQTVGCGYRAVASTFGQGAFVAQLPNDPADRLLVSTLPMADEETIEGALAAVGPGARFASWGCGDAGEQPPPWLRAPRPLRWIGGLYAADATFTGTYRPFRLTEAFDAVAYFPAVTAEDLPPARPLVPPRPRAAAGTTE